MSIGTNTSDLEGHSLIVNFFEGIFLYRFAVVNKISTDVACLRCPSAVAKLLVRLELGFGYCMIDYSDDLFVVDSPHSER